jgi:exosortase
MLVSRKSVAALVGVSVSFLILYWQVITKLVRDWSTDDNYSHGFLIVPLAVYLAWERRHRLARLPMKPGNSGLLVLCGSLLVLSAGVLGAEVFLTRLAMLGTLLGIIVFLLGWQHLRALTFPLAFLLLMIPIPAILFNQIAFPLQLVASRLGEQVLSAWGIPVLREGNLIVLAKTTLEVAEACSGIRSLVSLLTLGIMSGYFTDSRGGVRVAITLATVPVAIAANGLRVAGTGIAAHYYGLQAAEGFFHTFSGWLVFVASFAMLFVVMRIIVRLAPTHSRSLPAASLGFTR